MKINTQQYGPWAFVTGASDGIGKAFAIALAETGFSLVLIARRYDLLEQLAQELGHRFGTKCNIAFADLATPAGVETVIQQTQTLDIGLLVAAAGYGTSGKFVGATLAEELSMIDMNCRAVVAHTHHFANRFKLRGSGGIVLMSSIVAFQGTAHSAHYAATKAFIQTFVEGLRIELKPHNVDVIAVVPGPVLSGFAERDNLRMGMMQSPDVVANGALAALGKCTTVRPGWLSKCLGYTLSTAPRWGRIRIMSAIMDGMTKHQKHR